MNIPTKYIEQYSQNAHAIEEKILQGVNLSGDAGFEEMFCKFINEFPEGNTIMYLWNCVFVFAQDPDFAIKVHNKISLSLVSAFNQLDPKIAMSPKEFSRLVWINELNVEFSIQCLRPYLAEKINRS